MPNTVYPSGSGIIRDKWQNDAVHRGDCELYCHTSLIHVRHLSSTWDGHRLHSVNAIVILMYTPALQQVNRGHADMNPAKKWRLVHAAEKVDPNLYIYTMLGFRSTVPQVQLQHEQQFVASLHSTGADASCFLPTQTFPRP